MNKIGIIGAMASEVEYLKSIMEVSSTLERAGMTFVEGKIGQANAVVVQSGIGKVNAGMCVQILVDEFNIDLVINTGVAGSLDAKIDIGDIVVSSDAVYSDVDVTPLGYPLGEMPGVGTKFFTADPEMVKKVHEICTRVNTDITAYIGRVASGDAFVASPEKKNFIVDNFQASCCEMEGCAIAQAAYLNKIPFIIIRAISDKADDSAEMDYPTFEVKAAKDCARLVEACIQEL